jgi:Domain of unknown function (DUF4411)
VPYCIDTSSLIAAWEERYPIDHFPNFWKLFEGAIDDGADRGHWIKNKNPQYPAVKREAEEDWSKRRWK